MKKFILLTICALLSVGSITAQTMSDKQVVEYIQSAMSEGKSQRQIATELASKGVTREQITRLQQQYGSQQDSSTEAAAVTRNRMRYATEDQKQIESKEYQSDNLSGQQSRTYKDQKSISNEQTGSEYQTDGDYSEYQIGEGGEFKRRGFVEEEIFVYDDKTIFLGEDKYQIVDPKPIFGRNIFNARNLTFAPNQNIATPANHKLGPGDEVIIDIWGANQTTISQTISPDGYINIESLGLISLNNMTVAEAERYLRKRLSAIYATMGEEGSASQIKVTLGQMRTIQIHVMGEVEKPGTYSLSSFSTAFYAIYHAGGVSELGSLRNISVSRKGKKVATVDVYDFIMNGHNAGNISLQDGDMIIVPPYESLVEVVGNVKRPMFYELTKDENISSLIKYAGDFAGNAYRKSITVTRQNGREYQIHTVDEQDYPTFTLMDGDKVEIGKMLDRFENRIEVQGAVYREGIYQLSEKINTVKKLIEKAEGVRDDAFLAHAVLHRERPDLTLEIIPLDISSILNGSQADVTLQKNDVLYIPSIHDLKDLGTIQVLGEVARPGVFPYAENATLEDMIIMAGGLLESASVVRVDVSRRILDPKTTESKEIIGEQFTFALKDGLIVDKSGENFTLKPYDQIIVRKSPTYQEQRNITVTGEVLYSGVYSLSKKTERISDIINRAGGITPFAYTKGARLLRQMNDDEYERAKSVLYLAKRNEKDSIDIRSLKLQRRFSVGIDLDKAIANPGSGADVVLRADDELIIPEMNNTVRISGSVMYPNTVSFEEGKTMKYFVEQAGGFTQSAKKRKSYIVYMNGQVKRGRLNRSSLIEPGCEIVVPMKEKNAAGLQNILSVATTSASLATMIASIANIIK